MAQKKEVQTMKEAYSLPDADCERLKRSELTALRMLLAHLSAASYVQDDLKTRLECIPWGNQRLRMAVGGLKSVCNDLIGTVSLAQTKQLYGTMKDYEIRMVPKLTPMSVNIILTKEQGIDLVNAAREKCKICVEDGISCRKCKLYKVLEATTPLDDYGGEAMCPYSLAEWEG